MSEKIVVRDKRRPRFCIDSVVMDKWLPFIGANGFLLYAFHCRWAGRENGRDFPTMEMIKQYTGLSVSTIRRYHELLAQYGLLGIEAREDGLSNDYFVRDVPDSLPGNVLS